MDAHGSDKASLRASFAFFARAQILSHGTPLPDPPVTVSMKPPPKVVAAPPPTQFPESMIRRPIEFVATNVRVGTGQKAILWNK